MEDRITRVPAIGIETKSVTIFAVSLPRNVATTIRRPIPMILSNNDFCIYAFVEFTCTF